ncbi:MAG: patatin-like phospholipase family protein [Thermodesulfovibrionales bacterium]|nr:patatin-like phospholipase family protein [Thermodesulfovibrionales bacterium]
MQLYEYCKKIISRVLWLVVLSSLLISCVPKETVRDTTDRPKIALVLGAGASKGFAHVGVIKVLEANGIPIDMVVGTSAGSFVGSLYAYGYSGFDLQGIALSITRGDIVDIAIPDKGFIKGEKLQDFINSKVKNAPIERFKIPFYAVATDITTGKEVVFGNGNAGMAVRASCAIPGVFRPVKIGNATYVDGGVVSPVSVDVARLYGADVVIAVDISGDTSTNTPDGIMETLMKSIDIMYSRIAKSQLINAQVVIRPKVSHIGSADFDKRHEAILEGEKAAQEAIPRIRELIYKARPNY